MGTEGGNKEKRLDTGKDNFEKIWSPIDYTDWRMISNKVSMLSRRRHTTNQQYDLEHYQDIVDKYYR